MISSDEIEHYRARLDQGAQVPYERAVRLLDAAEQLARLTALLETLRPLEAAATDAPWSYWPGYGISPEPGCTLSLDGDCDDAEPPDDTAFIIAARNALPEMLRVVGS